MNEYINPIKILVAIVLLYAIAKLPLTNSINRIVFGILILSFATEITNSVLQFFGQNIRISTTISILFHHGLWILLIGKVTGYHKLVFVGLTAFVLFWSANILFYEGVALFNYYSFVMGSFLYLSLFVYINITLMRKEAISFFLSNGYLLLFVPVIMFFGLSFMFAFRTPLVTSTPLLSSIKLWDFVIHYVNIIYYGLMILYIYNEKRLSYAS